MLFSEYGKFNIDSKIAKTPPEKVYGLLDNLI